MPYTTEISSVSDVTPEELLRLSEIYLTYYGGTDLSQFTSDFLEKSEVLRIRYQQQVVGFSTYKIYPYNWRGKVINVVFSGDTIIEKSHWGTQALAYSWLQRMGQILNAVPDKPLYWFLIVKGHRTYRYLPIFSRCFFPDWKKDTEELKALSASLAVDRFGDAYSAERGVVSFRGKGGYLKPAFGEPDSNESQKAAVQFFQQRNPGYQRGDELVCLCNLSPENLTRIARRQFMEGSSVNANAVQASDCTHRGR